MMRTLTMWVLGISGWSGVLVGPTYRWGDGLDKESGPAPLRLRGGGIILRAPALPRKRSTDVRASCRCPCTRRHRPADPRGAAGRWPDDQCRAGAPRGDLG